MTSKLYEVHHKHGKHAADHVIQFTQRESALEAWRRFVRAGHHASVIIHEKRGHAPPEQFLLAWWPCR